MSVTDESQHLLLFLRLQYSQNINGRQLIGLLVQIDVRTGPPGISDEYNVSKNKKVGWNRPREGKPQCPPQP